MNKTILIGCPTCGLDQDPSRWLDTLIKIQNQIRAMGMSQSFMAPYRMSWADANNMIWRAAFQYDFDYVLRLDDDVHGVDDDAIQRLLQADKDVIGAAYLSRHVPYGLCAVRKSEAAKERSLSSIAIAQEPLLQEIKEKSGIHRVDLVGFGMTLIRVAPFLDIEQPMFDGACENVPDDTVFADVCAANGIEQHVHMDVKLWHRDISPYISFGAKKED